MKPAMRNLVHARPPWTFGVPLSHRDQDQDWSPGIDVSRQDRAPLAGGMGDVELHATTETRPIVAFCFVAPKPLTRHALLAQRRDNRFYRRPTCRRAVSEVLREDLIDYPHLEAQTRAPGHRCCLSLTVGG